jgi:hypothetical protein
MSALEKAIAALRRIDAGKGTQRDLAEVALFLNDSGRAEQWGGGLVCWHEVVKALAEDPDDDELYAKAKRISRG